MFVVLWALIVSGLVPGKSSDCHRDISAATKNHKDPNGASAICAEWTEIIMKVVRNCRSKRYLTVHIMLSKQPKI